MMTGGFDTDTEHAPAWNTVKVICKDEDWKKSNFMESARIISQDKDCIKLIKEKKFQRHGA